MVVFNNSKSNTFSHSFLPGFFGIAYKSELLDVQSGE